MSTLDQAAHAPPPPTGFPHDLIALVDPADDVASVIQEHDQPQEVVDLSAAEPRSFDGQH